MSDATDTSASPQPAASFYQSGWRPMIGWICVLAFAYQFIARPVFDWVAVNLLKLGLAEALDVSTLLTLLGLAGAGIAYRTVEKLNGVASQ